MAVGDDAYASGFPLVPNNGEEGRVRWGAREINRTRDFVAQIKSLLNSHTHLGPEAVYASCNTSLVDNGTKIIPNQQFGSVPYPTRVFVQAMGTAGFNATRQSTSLRIVGYHPIIQGVENGAVSDPGEWTTVVRSGTMDIPANTQSNVALQGVCTLANGKAYYRIGFTAIRIHI